MLVTIKNKIIHILLLILLIVGISTISLAVYYNIFKGKAIGQVGDVIISLKPDEVNNLSTITLDENTNSYEYKFHVENYKMIEGQKKVNEVLCDYYIKIPDLSISVPLKFNLYYLDNQNNKTKLIKIQSGEFKNYYKPTEELGFLEESTHTYILEILKRERDTNNLKIDFSIDVGYEQKFKSTEKPNPPDLAVGMIPVIYNSGSSKWQTISKDDSNWYDYENKKWANVVTVSNYETYKNTTGKDVEYSDITSMFVWIPRYVYRIPANYYHTTITRESVLADTLNSNIVDIQFSKSKAEGGDYWNSKRVVIDSEKSDNCSGLWTTNDAFDFGDKYLNGIWVAKFKASDSVNPNTSAIGKLNVKPATDMKIRVSYKDAFTACRNMEDIIEYPDEYYSWATSSGLQGNGRFSTDTNNIDIHLTKNSEWAALAFFASSKYGLNKDSDTTVFEDEINKKYTGYEPDPINVFESNSHLSTTGNEYGIYDTASLMWEMVCGYIGDSSSYNAGIIHTADSKYKDQYMPKPEQTINYGNRDSVYSIFENIDGAAIWETSTNGNVSNTSWFGGRSNIGTSSSYSLFLARGGSFQEDQGKDRWTSSTYSFGYGNASEQAESRSFRPVIAVGDGL